MKLPTNTGNGNYSRIAAIFRPCSRKEIRYIIFTVFTVIQKLFLFCFYVISFLGGPEVTMIFFYEL
jgi:hypothetical protein